MQSRRPIPNTGSLRVVAWWDEKVGLTAKAVQLQLGVDQPDFGVLFADMQIAHQGDLPMSTARLPFRNKLLHKRCGGSAKLRYLLIGGRIVVEDGAIPGLDLQKLKFDAARVVTRLAA
ncbi:hypothetical protein [Bradyrhizobium sp. LVM 105]|uniref:hypothetical protein n=1 Tax=Bradyrhizobium sp. LVM 105 TaxID=2341115 RepID=UPI00196A6FCB|nr:hypothetical protein [Bradyrhizobium sp. LVM 105]